MGGNDRTIKSTGGGGGGANRCDEVRLHPELNLIAFVENNIGQESIKESCSRR